MSLPGAKKISSKRRAKKEKKPLPQPPTAPAQAYIQDLFERFRAADPNLSLTERKLCEKLSEHEKKAERLSQELTKVENEIQSFQRRRQQLQVQLTQQSASAQTVVEMLEVLWEAKDDSGG